tara:strand:- start:10783 stop:11421 length:639 start_codon:yes stop_codon:yes gene_type:complete
MRYINSNKLSIESIRKSFQKLRSNTLFLLLISMAFLLLSSENTFSQDTSITEPSIGTNQKIGDVFLFALPAATLAISYIIGDKKGAWQFTKGIVLTEAITYGLKLGINKQRPDNSNDNSFPSGHTSTVFHSAGYIHRRYGFKYAIPSYLIAGFTAASRIDSKKHDLYDVVAGIVIGLGSNLLFTTEQQQQENIRLTYNKLNGYPTIGLSYKF